MNKLAVRHDYHIETNVKVSEAELYSHFQSDSDLKFDQEPHSGQAEGTGGLPPEIGVPKRNWDLF
ncbi:MAG: hypothetical protein ACREF7_03805 [Candidatus Saccharimonadales bacterium]